MVWGRDVLNSSWRRISLITRHLLLCVRNPLEKTVIGYCMPNFIVITALIINNEAEPDCRLHNYTLYELKFNRNNLLQFKYIFSINILRLKWFLLVITYVHSLNKCIFYQCFITCMFDTRNYSIVVLFYFLYYNHKISKHNNSKNGAVKPYFNPDACTCVRAPECALASLWSQSPLPCGPAHRPCPSKGAQFC